MAKRKVYTLEDIDQQLRDICSDEDLQSFLDSMSQGLKNLHCINCGNIYDRKSPWDYLTSDLKVKKDTLLLCPKCARSRSGAANARKMWDNPESVQQFKDSRKKYYEEHPEELKELMIKINNSASATRSTKNYKLKMKEQAEKQWQSESHRSNMSKKQSDKQYKFWNSKNKEERTRLSNYVKEHPECINNANIKRSSFELEIESYIHSLGLKTEHTRSILDGKELDIYIPSKNTAIECNGLYWHTYPKKDYTYHFDKFLECKSKGIHLIQITDYDWYSNQEKIKAYLHDLMCDDKVVYYARKLNIKQVDSITAKEFYRKYHLQGCNRNFSINYGLYEDNELISCMSFDKSRVFNRRNPEGFYELHRYCVKFNCTVLGGAEKLFKHFIIEYNPLEIKSFSDNDYFSGNIYNKLKFSNVDTIRVYYWVNLYTGDLKEREKSQLSYLQREFKESYDLANKLKESNTIGNREVFIMENEGYSMYITSGRTKWVYYREER